ncbi:MAG: SurA N-terminal domain-containing protein [Candidatus Saccharibacteria bacterium]|nr:SurA N-terminal domain-containing protein [Candidatus Saccharibacteria bacterium]
MVKRLVRKIKKRDEEAEKLQASRITNETVAEHREQILAGGRKFKYPIQYERHRLLINSILVFLVALILSVFVLWWQLYLAQNTGNFFYRTTQLIPLPVASVDKQPVPFSDYLMEYRSSIHWLQQKSRGFSTNSQDSKRQYEHFKRQSLNKAIENAYAQKLADKYNVVVSDTDIDNFIDQTIKSSSSRNLSRESYETVLSDSYGVSPSEYRSIVRYAILKQKASFAIDKAAKNKADAAMTQLAAGKPFEEVVVAYSDDPLASTTKGDVGFVDKTNQDQGLAEAASKLQINQTTTVIKGTDGYYIVKLLETKGDQIRYARIKVSLNEFDSSLSELKKAGKVNEYIKVEKNA